MSRGTPTKRSGQSGQPPRTDTAEQALGELLDMSMLGRAEADLAKLASALFPAGEPDLSQLTWRPSPNEGRLPQRDNASSLEHRLRAADLRYRTLVEQIPAVTFLAVLGEGDNEIYISPYIETLLGFTQQEWLENPFLWYSQLHRDDRALWHDEFSRGIRTGGPFRAECRFIARDGRVVWVRGEARVVKDEIGRPLFLQGVAFDITESKRTHTRELLEAIRTTERRYHDLVEHLDAIIWEARTDSGTFTFVSGGVETILGFSREQWMSDPEFWLTRVHSDDRDAVASTWTRARQSEEEVSLEFRAFASDDREVWLHMRTQPPLVATGDRHLFGVMLDVTQRKRAEEERERLLAAAEEARRIAERANRAKDEFLATMSHELKTPLNALIGYAQLLQSRQMPADLIDRALESIERNAKAQGKLVDDLLDVSRIITGKLHLEVRHVDLAEVIDAAIDTVRLAADAKRLTLERHLDRSGLRVMGDAARLQQVFWNLLSNAVRFTPERGRIDVRLEHAGDFARVTVSDTGQGISPEFLPYVFERFRQADPTVTRRHGGLGLGLAIVRHLVEMHGGTISVESKGRERGATFTAMLPLSEHSSASETSDGHREESDPESLKDVRVLLVDDNSDALELLRTVFARAGADVEVAGSAAEALRLARNRAPDVVVSDIGMPDTDGYELIRRLRATPEGAAIRAVALTAYAGADHRRQALEAGFQEHVPKPVDVVQIVDLVGRLISSPRADAHR
ncbi:MAG: PAS domain-containing protein [Gemmatimonadota bacterium]|nr:PAS domain-containing protein [Gemmatimonadota bacterium]